MRERGDIGILRDQEMVISLCYNGEQDRHELCLPAADSLVETHNK